MDAIFHFRDVSSQSVSRDHQTSPNSTSSVDENPKKEVTRVSFVAIQLERQLNLGDHEVPNGVDDFDKENWNDIFQISHYAMDIFNYLKSREVQ